MLFLCIRFLDRILPEGECRIICERHIQCHKLNTQKLAGRVALNEMLNLFPSFIAVADFRANDSILNMCASVCVYILVVTETANLYC